MSNKCELTGKGPLKGHNVSHANNKTKRKFNPSIKKIRFKSDILNNPVYAIGSVANFLSKKGKWEPNTKIVLKATHSGERPKLKSSFKPYMKVSELKTFGITPVEK